MDLFPVFSFLINRGKCRYCHNPISICYWLLELVTALMLLGFKELNGYSVLLFLLCSILLILAAVDFQTMYVPESLLLACLFITVLMNQVYYNHRLSEIFLAILSTSGIMLLFNQINKDGFGSGDIKLMAIISLTLGSKTFMVMIWAVISAGIIAFYLRFFRNCQSRYLPFVPFLACGIIVELLGIVSFH